MLKIIDTSVMAGDETSNMSFLKGADRDDSAMDFSNYRGPPKFSNGFEKEDRHEYAEWDTMTARMEENYEITSEARDYNNNDLEDSRSEIQLDDEAMNPPDGKSSDAYADPYAKVDGGMAATESFTIWKQMMPVFAEMARLDYFKAEIRAGRKQYKDFYVYFRQDLLAKFDDVVSENLRTTSQFGTENRDKVSVGLKFWRDLPWDIRVKTYLTLYAVEVEAQHPDNALSEREINILRWSALLLHIGCAKPSKTSKVHVYSFLSSLYII